MSLNPPKPKLFSIAPEIKPPRTPVSNEGNLDMAYMNLEGTRRQSMAATERKYAQQEGGPRSGMQINESSGVGGGSGGGGQFGGSEQDQDQKDRAEFSGLGTDSVQDAGKLLRKACPDLPAVSLETCAKMCPVLVRIFLPFSMPIFLN